MSHGSGGLYQARGGRNTLKPQAALAGVSLNTYLRTLLTDSAALPTRRKVFDRIARRAERSEVSSVELIRGLREAPSSGDL